MELELGLKFTRVADEFTSDFQLAKDRAGALFVSRETDTVFVLTAHLKGYRRGNIKIDINEDGSLIGISGEKQVKETVMVGWKVYKKDAETKGFKKVFRIPNGVILDKIEAKFNEDESCLTITMPKKVKGIRGTLIEQVKEELELVKEGSGNLHIVDERSSDSGEKLKAKIENEVDDLKDEGKGPDMKNGRKLDGIEEVIENKWNQEVDKENGRKVEEVEEKIEKNEDQEVDKQKDIVENEERLKEEKELAVESRGDEECGKVEEKRCKMCLPIVAGSTLLLSFVVFVIQIIRSKNRSSNKRD